MNRPLLLSLFLSGTCLLSAFASDFIGIPTEPTAGDEMLTKYFERETRRLAERTEEIIDTTDWSSQQAELREQMFDMMGLNPLPGRTDLNPRITGSVERDGVVVENVVFESMPGLYVTANFYRPVKQDGPLPTILYQCGHGRMMIDDVSYGNKTTYQRHGNWFAKNGYTCLIIDTLQMGEIEATHHGTHHLNRWWWNSRGYTSAGVEAWNAIRALDYLETRPEVDKEKFGATGRSGGGASTLWITALDERIQAAVPVAGITSMHNNIVDGCVEGHCDCMFMVNTQAWDFPMVTALMAPRALLITNTEKDRILPIDGVVDVYRKTRRVYRALKSENKIGLAIGEGPHLDLQTLRVSAFHWFDRHLKGHNINDELQDASAPKPFDPKELKVFQELPENERNTTIDETFTPRATPEESLPSSQADWDQTRKDVLEQLGTRTFRGWPSPESPAQGKVDAEQTAHGIRMIRHSFESEPGVPLTYYLGTLETTAPGDIQQLEVRVLDEEDWQALLASQGAAFPDIFAGETLPEPDPAALQAARDQYPAQTGVIYFPPRGIGPTAWTSDEKERIHIRRRFALLGKTLDGMRIWDIRQALQAIRSASQLPVTLHASGNMAGNALYAALYEPDISRLALHHPPASHQEDGPELLNVLRFTDIPVVAALVAEKVPMQLSITSKEDWAFLEQAGKTLDWKPEQVQFLTD